MGPVRGMAGSKQPPRFLLQLRRMGEMEDFHMIRRPSAVYLLSLTQRTLNGGSLPDSEIAPASLSLIIKKF